MSVRVLGKCSICGGRVTVPLVWLGVIPPVPTCESCGAMADAPGPVIPMKPQPRSHGCRACGAIGLHYCTGGQPRHPGWKLVKKPWGMGGPMFKA